MIETLPDTEHVPPDGVISRNQICDFLAAIHDRGVVAAPERIADSWQGRVSFLAHQVHRHLPRQSDVFGPISTGQRLQAGVIETGYGLDDLRGGQGSVPG